MAEQSGFFNANLINGEYDRTYLAEHFARYFSNFIGNGIFSGKLSELMVTQSISSGMKVEVLPGLGYINGYWYENTNNLSLNIDVADGVLNRTDCIVLRWSKSDRKISAVVKKGSFASNSVAPSLQRDADVYELKLAEVFVKAGATSISNANITDTRYDSSDCGLVSSLIDQIDATELSGLLNAALNEVEIKTKSEIESIVDRLNAAVKDESAFANLILEVDDIAGKIALVNQTLGYHKKNVIPYPYANTSRTANGIKWTDVGDGTITADGVATGNSYFTVYKGKAFPKGKYTISSNADINGKHFIYIRFVDRDTSTEASPAVYGYNNVPFEITDEYVDQYDLLIGLYIVGGSSLSNVVFKPMLRRVEILDSTWEPYKLSVADMIQEDKTDAGCFYRMNRFTGIKEWINPPLRYGVEYCTTERWENKPVYQKTFFLSTLPNKSIASLETGTQWDKVISVNAYALDSDDLTYYPFPVILQGQIVPVAVISKVESDGSLVITTVEDVSYMKAYITVKYTKQ